MNTMGDLRSGLEEVDDRPQGVHPYSVVAFFAHKGGVSKTTNLYHLGWILAKEFGLRVLMVDADPQCNLTHTLLKKAAHSDDWRKDVERGDIYTAILPVHNGTKMPNEPMEPAVCVSVKPKEFKASGNGELLLLPGSLNLATIEPQLTFAHGLSNEDFPLFNDVAGAFRSLFHETAQEYEADIVMIDMGPSIGELNKNLFFSSDYFIIPCSPDQYCKNTIVTMQRTLPKWAEQQHRLAQATRAHVMPVKPDPPQFLGILMSLFQVAGANKTPVKHSQVWMNVVQNCAINGLVPALQDYNMVHPVQCDDCTLACIPHFQSLQPLAQRMNRPVIDLPDEMTEVDTEGNVKTLSKSETKRHHERAQYFHKLYQHFAEVFVSQMQYEE